ncbi:MAG: nitrogen regulation protein NR(II), partial [bacterium]
SLTSIRMLLQLLSETEYLQASERESVAVALNSFERIEQVVNDLLQLARPAALDRKTGDINTILEESIDLSRHHVSKKGIEVVHDLAPELPALRLDSHYIKEAFINLILNATQAIDGKGKITFCTAQKKLPQKLRDLGEIHTRTPGDEAIGVREIVLKKGAQVVSVQISDSGGGIAEAHQQRIFDPFFTTKVNGTGLGLSFVKRVVNEHGGIVSVKSEPGKGSTFTLTFPVE